MRFSTSALVVVLLQNSSLLSPNDAFSPPLSRVVKSSSSLTKNDGLYAQCDDDDNDGAKKRIITSSVLLGGAAFQLSTSKVSADLCSTVTQHDEYCSFSRSKSCCFFWNKNCANKKAFLLLFANFFWSLL